MRHGCTNATPHQHPVSVCRIVLGVAAAAFITVGAAGLAMAQENAEPTPKGRVEAPVGHRQPRPEDLPARILKREGSRTESEKQLDRTLNDICRGC